MNWGRIVVYIGKAGKGAPLFTVALIAGVVLTGVAVTAYKAGSRKKKTKRS